MILDFILDFEHMIHIWYDWLKGKDAITILKELN